jgi:hypothetical protein
LRAALTAYDVSLANARDLRAAASLKLIAGVNIRRINYQLAVFDN